jgi:hypothetical protein
MRRAARADYKRWSSPDGLERWWDQRTRALAELVPPHSRVIEFGAGRRQLEKFLPAGCTYTPSDLVNRGEGTIVCDLNRRPLPVLSLKFDIAVFGGVLEYVRSVPDVITWIRDLGVHTCVLSFDPFPPGLGTLGRYRESGRRAYYGYMNELTEEKLLFHFVEAGFACTQRRNWTKQLILQFSRRT